ncbi:MAG TPA: hypothetical protein VFD32_00175 [Dehalococcoidia bacterium]|nr:hypothetical protein [Dehalococcoidia bacterium]
MSEAPPELTRSSSHFIQYIASVRFLRNGQELSMGTAGWFGYLRRERASRLQFIFGPPPEPFGVRAFANANKWAIQVTCPDRWEVWNPRWVFDPVRRAWNVTYSAHELGQPYPAESDSLETTAANLKAAARDAEQVSRKMGAEPITKLFAVTQQALESQLLEPDWFVAMLPPFPHNPLARRMLCAVAKGWVFGGMGSWLDRGPDYGAASRAEYESTTSRLWDAVLSAVAVATNAYLEPAG